MTTPLTIPDAVVGDNILNDRNAVGALIEAAYNGLAGENLNAASVPTSALAKPKSFMMLPFHFPDLSTASKIYAKFKLPNVDGASNSTWVYTGYSVNARLLTGITATMDIRKNAVSMHGGPPINFAALVAGTSAVTLLVTPATLVSGDVVDLNFAWTAGSATDSDIVLFFTLTHVGT
jgi:hypothetical protein